MSWKDKLSYYVGWSRFRGFFYVRHWQAILGSGDAIVLVPYSDGALIPKRGFYEKNLIGNLPGYETADGDIYVSEGWGNPKFHLAGVPVVLALDPSEHSGVIDPLKSLIAHKRDLGEFVRVDKEGQVVEVGEAVKPADEPDIVDVEGGVEAAADGGAAAVETASHRPTDVNYEVHDGLFDVTPPMIKDPETGDVVDQADGWVVSQRAAADLVPSKTSSSELKLMQQRERNAMADATEMLKYLAIGFIAGVGTGLVFLLIWIFASGSAPSTV